MNFDFFPNDYLNYNHRLPSCLHNQVIFYVASRIKNDHYFLENYLISNMILNIHLQIVGNFGSYNFEKMAIDYFIIFFEDLSEELQKIESLIEILFGSMKS